MKTELHLFVCFWLIVGCVSKHQSVEAEKPNIIIIMADDLGYSDLGCYGGEINTPALDGLAANGLRFTQFFNASRCCPTRASLLTGLYPHEAGIGRMTMNAGQPGYQGELSDNSVTIAELLKIAGYQTGMTGKWHVSLTERREEQEQLDWLSHQKDYGPFSDTSTYPVARGFDKFFGNIWGVVDYFDPFSLVNGKEPVKTVPDNFYYTTALGDSAIAYISEFSQTDKPFFLYVAHCAPHWPLHALPEDIAKYEETYKVGWDAIRETRYNRMIKLGLFDSVSAQLSPRMFPEKNWENNPDKEWDARAMAVHAAMVDHMDRSIAKMIQKLEELNQLDNTVIMFLSDNGASYERPSLFGPGFDRAGSTRSGQNVFFPVEKDVLPGPQTVHSGIGPEWANVANTPFRYWKSKSYQGGIATPFIVHWPSTIVEPGKIISQPTHVIDLLSTCVQIAGGEYPTTFKGRDITPTPGKSILPILKSEKDTLHNVLFWEHFGSGAILKDGWKLVKLNFNSEWELFNIEEDLTELNDLKEHYPEKVKELSELWQELALEYQVYPMP